MLPTTFRDTANLPQDLGIYVAAATQMVMAQKFLMAVAAQMAMPRACLAVPLAIVACSHRRTCIQRPNWKAVVLSILTTGTREMVTEAGGKE